MEAVYEYVLKSLQGKNALGVCWYGGEPLLAFDVIERLSRRFMNLCRTLNIPYDADIISNGYLMTRERAEQLTRQMAVGFWQVTLDGPPEIHNTRRPLRGGKPTFEKILENVEATHELFDRISLRINVDKGNYQEVLPLLDILEERGLREKVGVYFGQVQPLGAACPSFAPLCLSTPEFARVDMDLTRILSDRNFPVSLRPNLRTAVCLADQTSCFLIDPKGNLAKCWNCAGIEEQRVGTVFDEAPNENYIRWLSFDPFEDSECVNCKFLPICMGGCPYEKVINGGRDCTPKKYNLIDGLKLRIDARQKCVQAKGETHE